MDITEKTQSFLKTIQSRRSVRSFTPHTVPEEAVRNCIQAACTAPSGANLQPWTFVLVGDPAVKQKIRDTSEKIEREFYEMRAPAEWKEKLEPLSVTWQKPFLTRAPWLICVFVQIHGVDDDGEIVKHYYPKESTGIAVGFLITAIHAAGLSTLTYTPAPMGFLSEVLNRPMHERPYMILPVGYPDPDYQPPVISRKSLDDMLITV